MNNNDLSVPTGSREAALAESIKRPSCGVSLSSSIIASRSLEPELEDQRGAQHTHERP